VKIDCILVISQGAVVRLPNTLDLELQCYNTAIARVTPLVKGKPTSDLEKIPTESVIQEYRGFIVYSFCAEFDRRIAEYRNGNLHKLV
jgi:hypothetical protein